MKKKRFKVHRDYNIVIPPEIREKLGRVESLYVEWEFIDEKNKIVKLVFTNKKNDTRTCPECGKNFEVSPSSDKKFCSRACANRYNAKRVEVRKKLSKAKKGKTWEEIMGEEKAMKLKEKWRERMRGNKLAKGNIPWNKGFGDYIKGERNPMYGKPRPKEVREKIRETLLRKGFVPWNKGYGDYIKGPKNPNWRGGISEDPYPDEFNKELKEQVRRMYGYRCAICGMTEEESIREIGMRLVVHHIDFNKYNNNLSNLIPLCQKCHGRITAMRIILRGVGNVVFLSRNLRRKN